MVAVEIEERLAARLQQTVRERMGDDAAERLRVVAADALQVDALPGPAPTSLVANLPYNVSVPVLLRMLELFPDWTDGLVMVQLEVADRLVAPPGSKVYGVPSAKVAWYAESARVGTVPPKVFWPVPNVESGLVRITRRPAPATTASREDTFPGDRCRVLAASQDAALRPGRPGRVVDGGLGADRGGGPGPHSCAARCWTSTRSPPSPAGLKLTDCHWAVSGSLRYVRGVTAVRVRVPAKVNLALRVGGTDAQGYHELGTVFQAVSLGDEVVAEWAPAGEFRLAFQGEGAAFLPVDDTNLAMRSAKLLAERFGRHDVGVSLLVRKRIPVAGGMAGVSADAAGCWWPATRCGRSASRGRTCTTWLAEIGSDVPFLLLGGTAIGTGRGEDPGPGDVEGTLHWTLALSHTGLSTPPGVQGVRPDVQPGTRASPWRCSRRFAST